MPTEQFVFRTVHELRRALEHYHLYRDPKPTLSEHHGGEDDYEDELIEHGRLANAAIDILMEEVKATQGALFPVLDYWYIHGWHTLTKEWCYDHCLNQEVEPWQLVAHYAKISKGCRWKRSQECFEEFVRWGVLALFDAQEVRRER